MANCLDRQTAGPKGNLSPFGHVMDSYVVSTRYEGHGVKYRPKVTENGYTERGNPPWLSQVKLEQVTNRKSRWSRMP
jgi:hypothetical protein